MMYRKLDTDGDYTFGQGKQAMHQNTPECVAQAVRTRLRLLAGEWFLDLAEGTQYANGVYGRHTKESYDLVIRSRILGTEGVTAIMDYDSVQDANTRKLTVTTTIDTVYGEVRLAEVM
jgi:uncharacterized membrane-anchored protein